MDTLGRAKRVRIYVSEDDRAEGRPLHLAILELLRREHAQGATVWRGVEGFGAAGRIHAAHLVEAAWRLPVVIEWVDRAEQVERLAPRLRALVGHGLITVDDTEVLLFEPHPVRDLAPTAVVGDVMSRGVVSARRSTPVRHVVELTLGKTYRAVPVVEEGRPVGIVTSGDRARDAFGGRAPLRGDRRDAAGRSQGPRGHRRGGAARRGGRPRGPPARPRRAGRLSPRATRRSRRTGSRRGTARPRPAGS
jgi:PII-like signaling protein